MSATQESALAVQAAVSSATLEKVVAMGDLSVLTAPQRLEYYEAVCKSIGLNPLTRPFEYIVLNEKMVLYARKDATDQLRDIRKVSLGEPKREIVNNICLVTVPATLPDGRMDWATGAVSLVKEEGEWKTAQSGKRYFAGNGTYKQLSPDDTANAFMKCETKAKRRVTLSICGLGFLDETEIETIPTAKIVEVKDEPIFTEPTTTETLIEDPKPVVKLADQPSTEKLFPVGNDGLKVCGHYSSLCDELAKDEPYFAYENGKPNTQHIMNTLRYYNVGMVNCKSWPDIRQILIEHAGKKKAA